MGVCDLVLVGVDLAVVCTLVLVLPATFVLVFVLAIMGSAAEATEWGTAMGWILSVPVSIIAMKATLDAKLPKLIEKTEQRDTVTQEALQSAPEAEQD